MEDSCVSSITRGIPGSSGSDSETDEPAGVGCGDSSLEAAGQDMDGSSKSGGGSRTSRGSLTSPDIKTPQGFR